jgi:hypothetical protein
MEMRKRFSGRKKSACRLAAVFAFVMSLCAAQATKAQQWTTCGTNNVCTSNATGNVGVGTSAPQAKLDVEGSSPYGISGVFSALYAKGTADYPMALMLDGAGTNDNLARLRALNNGQTKWQVNFGDDIVFYNWLSNAFNSRFSISGSGHIGIGTTNPVFDANAAKFLLLDAGSGVMDGEIGVGSNQPGTGNTVGQYAFVNSNLSVTDRRVATIAAATDGATNSGSIQFYTWNAGVVAERMRIDKSGNVGVGTASPVFDGNTARYLTLDGGSGVIGSVGAGGGTGSAGTAISQFAVLNTSLGTADKRIATVVGSTDTASNNGRVDFYTWSGPSSPVDRMTILANGNVGVGNASPAVKLDVAGGINASGDITASGNIQAKYQDVAEWVPSTQKLSAGTVVVLDTNQTNHVVASNKAYDTRVAGVVSASPGVILGEGGDGKLKVATTGRLKVRVDATRAPIQVGDLLVTGDVEGVAMKSIPVDLGGTQIHRPGTIIGKALEPLEKGAGEILVLLSLQ